MKYWNPQIKSLGLKEKIQRTEWNREKEWERALINEVLKRIWAVKSTELIASRKLQTNKQTKKCVYNRSSHKAPGGGNSGWVVMLCS